MTRKMVGLLLMACAACGGSAGYTSQAVSGGVDFTRYGAFELWPCGPNAAPQPTSCDGIVRQYVAALAGAQVCDPHADSCVRRPVGGLGPGDAIVCNCTTSVKVASTGAADAVLTNFYATGCIILCCPCPSPPPP